MKIFSHRGFHRDVPENTLEAFEAAIALGVDGIETDIRITCDGVPILHHNPQTPDDIDIQQLTQAEISKRVGYDVPRLEEAIALTQHLDSDFCWNLELKTRDSFAIALNVLKTLNPKTSILFSSFWHDGIGEMARNHNLLDQSNYSYGLVWASHPFGFDTTQWFEAYPHITTLVFNQERLSQKMVQQCQEKGKKVAAYGDRTVDDQAKLISWGIDALITDYPQLLR